MLLGSHLLVVYQLWRYTFLYRVAAIQNKLQMWPMSILQPIFYNLVVDLGNNVKCILTTVAAGLTIIYSLILVSYMYDSSNPFCLGG
jgi:hypothetical protein